MANFEDLRLSFYPSIVPMAIFRGRNLFLIFFLFQSFALIFLYIYIVTSFCHFDPSFPDKYHLSNISNLNRQIPPQTSAKNNAYLAILILSSPTSIEQRQVIRNTWLRLNNINGSIHYRFVIGGYGLDQDQIRALNSENNDILILDDIVDSYDNLTRKVLSMFVRTYESVNFQFLLKVDEDSFVRLDAFYQELVNIDHPNKWRMYWGSIYGDSPVVRTGKWTQHDWILCDYYLPYAAGGGYVLSKALVEYLVRNKNLFKIYNNEDVSVGAWLAGLDVYYRHDINFDTEWTSRGCRNSYLITHKQSEESMLNKHKNLMEKGELCDKEQRLMDPFEYNWKVPASKCCKRSKKL